MQSKLGLFLINGDEEYHRINAAETESAARKANLEIQVFDAKNVAAQQGQDIVRFAAANTGKRLCALVVPVADAIHEGPVTDDPIFNRARRALQKGMGWITLNHGRLNLVTALRSEFPDLPVAIVAIDNVEFGRIQARQLRALLPGGGTALCVLGNLFDSACRDRMAGFRAELADSGIVLEEVDGRWDRALTETVVHKWLTSSMGRQRSPQAVVCQNDLMGLGARIALTRASQETGRSDLLALPVLGGDGLPGLGQRWVDEGTLTATVCVTLPGKPAVELLARHWLCGDPLPPRSLLEPRPYPPSADVGRGHGGP